MLHLDILSLKPKNETNEHFLLKRIGISWLTSNENCYAAAGEIGGFSGSEKFRRADAVGVRSGNQWVRKRDRFVRLSVGVFLIEVKVSRSDFRSGYAKGANYNYLLTIPNLINPEELEPHVGLLEHDLHIGNDEYGPFLDINAVKVVKPAIWNEVSNLKCRINEVLSTLAWRYTSLQPGTARLPSALSDVPIDNVRFIPRFMHRTSDDEVDAKL